MFEALINFLMNSPSFQDCKVITLGNIFQKIVLFSSKSRVKCHFCTKAWNEKQGEVLYLWMWKKEPETTAQRKGW